MKFLVEPVVLRSGVRRQGGAVTIYVIAAIVALLTAAFAVFEVGRVYLYNREVQKMASLAALDAVREVSGCDRDLDISAGEIQQNVLDKVNDSLSRNGNSADVAKMSVDIDIGTIQAYTSNGQLRRGLTETRNGSAIPATEADAVRVTLTSPLPGLLTGLLERDSDTNMQVSATAEQAALGSLFVGSGLLGLDTQQSALLNPLLSGLLGGSVNLSLVQYNGLASANVSLETLATALGVEVSDLSDPLATQTSLPQLLNALAPLVDGTTSGTGQSLTSILSGLGSTAAGNPTTFPLSDVLGPVVEIAAGVPVINVLDLLIGLGAAAAPQTGGVVTPINLNIGLPLIDNLVSAQVFIALLEPPQFSGLQRAGEAQAKTAQIRLMVRAQVDAISDISAALRPLLGLLGALGTTITADPINLGVDIDIASAAALLESLSCPTLGVNNGQPIAGLSVEPGVATVTIGTFTGASALAPPLATGISQLTAIKVNLLSILGLQVAELNLSLFLDQPVSTRTNSNVIDLDPVTAFARCDSDDGNLPAGCDSQGDVVSDEDYWQALAPVPDNPQTVGSSQTLQSTLSSLTSDLSSELRATDPANPAASSLCLIKLPIVGCTLNLNLGAVLDAVVSTVSSVLSPVLTSLGTALDSLVDPLLASLGIQIGTATVTMNAVTIDRPVIVNTLRPFEVGGSP